MYDLFGTSIPFWSKQVEQLPTSADTLTINVSAEQFVWRFQYPGADGKFGKKDFKQLDKDSNPLGIDKADPNGKDDVVNMGEMFLPVNRPVVVRISAKDVIHSFGVPSMRLKQDAIPGLVVPISFTPTVTTAAMREQLKNDKFEYEIACSQLCGIGHSKMRGRITVLDQDAYEKKLSELSASAAAGGNDEW
jgi:cytochrome c oxidase subunit 2